MPVPEHESEAAHSHQHLTWWTAVLFMVGSFWFALGSFPPYFTNVPATVVAVTFFAGSICFTLAGYLQFVASGADGTPATGADGTAARRGVRLLACRPAAGDWWVAAVQLVGTLMFNISTFSAISKTLTTHQEDRLVWAPDAFGSIAFLVSSYLAFFLVAHAAWSFRPASRPWRIAALNLAGSVAFGVSAVGAYVLPTTGEFLDPRWANAGTFLGAVCFLAGAALLLPRAPPADIA
jgi:hypothetical protein